LFGDPYFPILAIIVFVAYQIGATTGFGSAVIALTFAVNFYPIDSLIPVVVPLNVVICSILAIRHHSGIQKEMLLRKILPPVCLGMPVGLMILNLVDTGRLKWAFGLFVLIVSSSELLRTARAHKDTLVRPLSTVGSITWLLGGGIIQGLWVSGGPPIAYWAGRSLPEKGAFRSTLSCLFLILNVLLFVTHLAIGRITLETLKISLLLLPAVLLGILVGEWLHVKLPERGFRMVVFVVLVFAGTSIVIRG
jgi:uncharacterized membrane protein YfcA